MNIKELEEQINEKVVGLTFDSKFSIKGKLCLEINEVLKANGYSRAFADYRFSDKSNTLKIRLLDENESFNPLYITYKTSRKTVKKNFYYNESTFTIKSVTIENSCYETVEDWMKAEIDFVEKRKERRNAEVEQLKDYMKNNPDFVKMSELYLKYKYSPLLREA